MCNRNSQWIFVTSLSQLDQTEPIGNSKCTNTSFCLLLPLANWHMYIKQSGRPYPCFETMVYVIIASSLVLCDETDHLKACKYFFHFIFFFLFRMPEIVWKWNHMLLSYQDADDVYWNPSSVGNEQICFRASDVWVWKFMSEFELHWADKFNTHGKLQLFV